MSKSIKPTAKADNRERDHTPDQGRRKLLKATGKALYIAPTITLLSLTANDSEADIGCPPDPPTGSFQCP